MEGRFHQLRKLKKLMVNHGESVNPVRYISRTAKKLCFTASKEFFSQLRVVFFVPVESMES